jgi:thiamine-phosphate pyrophosphorylase
MSGFLKMEGLENHPPMQNSRVTPGVERILNRARQLAREAGAAELLPQHLFWALFQEESRGQEILEQHAITAESLPGHSAPQNANIDAAAESPLEAGELVQQVLSKAGIHAARQGRYAELGSEHLLFGLAAVDSNVADRLKHHGLTTDVLGKLLDAGEEEPLAVDFQLAEAQKSACDQTDLYRILDAAANRVREGVRVLEDYARFARDDSSLSSQLKSWRHDLRSALSQIDDRKLLISRDTGRDVGTAIDTPAERHRQTLDDVLRANCKRAQEGLRTLEEYGKILSPVLGEAVSQLRYRFYTIEKRLVIEDNSLEQLAGRTLYLLATRDHCHLDFELAIRIALNAGTDIVQLREKQLPDREILELGRKLREWTREAGALFIMNDRPDLAVLADADGVHVGQEELTVREVRRIVGPKRLIGVSTHSIEQARLAVEEGADYLGVGPVFPSQTKPFSELAGLDFVRQAAQEIRLPWYAIGGISPENVAEVLAAGATRIAVSDAVCSSDSPSEIVTQFKEAMNLNPTDP